MKQQNLQDSLHVRVHLRKPLLVELHNMRAVRCIDSTLEEFLSELLEVAVADFRAARIDHDAHLPGGPVGALVSTPAKKRNQKKVDAQAIGRMRHLNEVEKVPIYQIAKRYAVSPETVRRYLHE